MNVPKRRTLSITTDIKEQSKQEFETMWRELFDKQTRLPPDFEEVLYDNLDELYEE